MNEAISRFDTEICTNAYTFLGCHKKGNGYVFRVWAPNASAVSLVGDFTGWDKGAIPMQNIGSGIWEGESPDARKYDKYKYRIDGKKRVYKSDPYAFHTATPPETDSKVYSPEFEWEDGVYLAKKRKVQNEPILIYEVHLGSWRRYADGNYYTYREHADGLVRYVKEMGYTHVELMPIAEYPFAPSWGYQVTGFYAPTSRFGSPEDFAYFVNACHKAGIGVILDWVGAHFPKDENGLAEFDGTFLYEYADPLKREHPDWNTRIFDYGRNGVCSFLISNIVFWMRQYHIDGFRVDAVASMLYLDYGKRNGSWRPNRFGGNQNEEAIAFLKRLCSTAFAENENVLMIAEESTAFPMVTKPPYDGGLGFNFKWNMGWMHDMLSYMEKDPLFRKGVHQNLTFSMTYAFSETFILPLSHDEVVHGKRSMIEKMYGSYEEKFHSLRAFYAYMMAHPGKKLTFMGNEFAQFSEWDFQKELDWQLLAFPMHQKMHRFVRELNWFYRKHPSLWENDADWDGFQWIASDDAGQSVIVFRRIRRSGEEIICVCNFCPIKRPDYRFGVPKAGVYRCVFSTDREKYGGTGLRVGYTHAEEIPFHGLPYSIEIPLPPLSVLFYERQEEDCFLPGALS